MFYFCSTALQIVYKYSETYQKVKMEHFRLYDQNQSSVKITSIWDFAFHIFIYSLCSSMYTNVIYNVTMNPLKTTVAVIINIKSILWEVKLDLD